MKRKWTDSISRLIHATFAETTTKYVIIIILIISFLLIVQASIDGTDKDGRFLSQADKLLALSFVEWFGVLYGFLLPTILVRVWEQFDNIDNVMDREADAVKSLMGDLMLLDAQYEDFRKQVLCSLFKYSRNVIRFVNGERPESREKKTGDKTLREIRGYYINIFRNRGREENGSDILKDELLTQLNNIVDSRGDRISLSTQRLFQSLNFIAITTSIIWLVPFYFLYFQDPQTGEELHLGIFGWLLVISVTFLIIIILSIIDDLDKPFDGFWKVTISSWVELIDEIKNEFRNKKPEDTHNDLQKTLRPTAVEGGPATPGVLNPIEVLANKEEDQPFLTLLKMEDPNVDGNVPAETPPQKQSEGVAPIPSLPLQGEELPTHADRDEPSTPELT